MPKALFLDRDGVINEEVHYAHRPDQIRFMPGIFLLCRAAKSLGYHLVVVTNQAGIARGIYTEEQFQTLTTWMHDQFAAEQITLDAVLHSPWHPTGTVAPWNREHEDRKPSPGMILRAATMFSLDLSQSLLIGDRCTDIAAANAAGLRHALLLPGTEPAPCPGTYTRIATLAEALPYLV